MSENWMDILSNQGPVDPKKLMDYLEGRLPDSERHEVEKILADSEFLQDALEGLQQMENKEKLGPVLNELNRQLHLKTMKRSLVHRKRKLPDQTLIIIATVTILVLVVLAYLIFRMYTSKP